MQRTLAICKPDCVARQLTGQVLARIEAGGFRIVALRMTRLSRAQAEGFYEVHRGKPFYAELMNFMTEGPVVVAVLEKEGAVEAWRALMGATNPAAAAPGTLRRDLAESMSRNIVHGSDSDENARREIAFFFSASDLLAAEK
ncbi:MAG TPA: nucleoside-diphosphate kinase [bacterium]|nr:nucleoside-diphosphate kinase [bacterium]HPR86893.1 nucleoside-diphosphate kinase [bacterium]